MAWASTSPPARILPPNSTITSACGQPYAWRIAVCVRAGRFRFPQKPPNLLISCAVYSSMVYTPFLAIIQKHRYRALKSVNCGSFCAKLSKLSVRVDARHWPVDAPCRKFHSIFRPIQTTCRFPIGGAHCVKPPRPIITYHLNITTFLPPPKSRVIFFPPPAYPWCRGEVL